MWDQRLFARGDRIRSVVYESLTDPVVIEADLFKLRDEFPYHQLRLLKIRNLETGSSIKFKLIEQRYGPVPEVKLQFPDFTGWERVDCFELK
jgi:hypothetical protein